MSRNKKIILIASAIFAALILLSITVLPAVVRSWLTEEIRQITGRKTSLQSLSFNPLTMTVAATGFAMEEQGGGPFIGVGGVSASLSPSSIYKRALIVSAITIEKPVIVITRKSNNLYNFNDIQQRLQANKKQKSQEETRFSINNITIKGGAIDFNDMAVAGGRKHTIRNLEVGIPFISNIPYMVEKYTAPKISAVVNGAPFNFTGKMKPLSKSMETSVQINLKKLDIPELVAYSPQKPPARLAAGKVTIYTRLNYRVFSDKKPELSINGLVRLDDIALNLNDGQPLVRLPLLEVQASKLELFAKLFQFTSIRLNGLELFVSRDGRGQWMYAPLIPAEKSTRKAESEKPSKADKDMKQPSLLISSLALTNSSIHFNDAQAKGGFKSLLSDIAFSVKNFSNAPNTSAEYELALFIDKEASLNSKGSFSTSPLSLKSSTALKSMNLQKGWPYLTTTLTAPIKGVMDLSGDVSYTQENGLTAEHANLTLKDISTHYGNKDGLALSHFGVSDAAYKQKENYLEIAEMKLSKGSLSISREADGGISPLLLFKKGEKPAMVSKQRPKSSAPRDVSRQFSYRLKRFQTDRLNIAFTDKKLSEKPRFTMRNTSINLTNLSGPKFTPATFNCRAIFNKNTPFGTSGEITPLPFRYRGNLSVRRLAIRDFEDYFPDNLNVSILGGYLDSSLKVDINLKNGKPEGTFKGNAGIRSFHSIDANTEEDLLKWESLQLNEFQGKLEPFSLAIRQIAVNGIYSRITILKDGTLNLQNLVEQPVSTTPVAASSKAESPPMSSVQTGIASTVPQQTVSAPKRQINIGAITIQGGTLAFSDSHLPQHFSTTFYNLGGRVSGMSSDDSRFADVDLRGNLENRSPILITGTINPLRDDLFVDLKVAFRDIELSPITPYSGTYLGYTVEKGKLYLDLQYHIERKMLKSENKIFFDQFTLGSKVASKDATSLPVKLGLALLKDRKGEIHLDVPVTGRTDDPQFSIWRLVFQVIRNLLVKAATSPLSLLSSTFGGGMDLSTIEFSHGAATLTSTEEKKLNALAKALADRPALKMELKGYVDREKDPEGYRIELLNRKMLNEKMLSLAKNRETSESNVDINKIETSEYSKYLKAVYSKEKFAKPRNFLGLVKNLPDDEMKKLIIANTIVTDAKLQSLAQERSAAVMTYLVKHAGIPAERVFLKKDDIYKVPEKNSQMKSRVELNAISP